MRVGRNTIAATLIAAGMLAGMTWSLSGCNTAPSTKEKKTELSSDVKTALARAESEDPSLKPFLDRAQGYAVFPNVGKGGFIVGGAYGRGEVFEKGKFIGYCDISQGTVGAQVGGQAYTEIIAFQTKEALQNFKNGHLKFSAQATAVALKSGAGANAKYTDGVAVFTFNEQGLMAEASVGGQSFSFVPATE